MDKETVDQARKEAEVAYTKFKVLKDAYLKAENDYLHKLRRFQNFDHELAEVDGRLKKLPPQGQRKEKKPPELTVDQLRKIAATLGINIDVDEDKIKDEFIEVSDESTTSEG